MKNNREQLSGKTLWQEKSPKRNNKIDVLRGLAIISMVAAHCGIPCTDYIYLFHMAVFMMAAGYFYSNKNSATLKAVLKYSYKKVLALYIPYVVVNGAFVLLHNFFVELKLYTYDPQFLEIGAFGAAWGLVWPYTPRLTAGVLGSVLKFQHEQQLTGASWFLRALFYVSIGHCVIMWLIQKIKPDTLRRITLLLLVCCVGAATAAVNKGTLVVPDLYKMLACCYLAYLLGIFVQRVEHLMRYDVVTAVFAFVLLYLLNPVGDVSLNVGRIHQLGFYIICSLLGWILLRSVAELLAGPVSSFFAYAGRYAMSIVFFHFISFKLVTLVVILLRGDNMLLLASFPQLDGAEKGLWIPYTIVGTALPLLLSAVYQPIKGKTKDYIRGKYESICNRCRRSAGSRCDE